MEKANDGEKDERRNGFLVSACPEVSHVNPSVEYMLFHNFSLTIKIRLSNLQNNTLFFL